MRLQDPFIFNSDIEHEILNNTINYSRGTLTEIHISDIHFGVIDPKYQYDTLMEQFVNKISHIHFDILSIDGDIFEHKFMSNSSAVYYAILFIDNLVQICRNKNATLMIIGGTEKHDADQIKLFHKYLYDSTVDIRIIENNIKFEYVKGAKILCIPELYNKGREYYEPFLNQPYDSVFMHGSIKGSIYGNDNDNLDSRAPTFSIEDFQYCFGPIIAGHVHTAGCFHKHCYYNGAPMRYRFGEEEKKGFIILLHNLDTHKYYMHFEEIQSMRYDTIELDNIILEKDPRDIINYIEDLHSNGVDYIRLKITLNNDNDKINSSLEIIKNYFTSKRYVKIDIKNNKMIQYQQSSDQFLQDNIQYDYILDKSLNEYEILSRYINQQMNCQYITADEIKEILNDSL